MPNSPGSGSPEPPSLEKRLPLALALMMLVLLVSQYLFKPAPGPKPVKPEADKQAAQVVQKPASPQVTPVAPVHEGAPSAGQVQAPSGIVTQIDTSLYHIVFTNRGAVAKIWVLKRYQDDAG